MSTCESPRTGILFLAKGSELGFRVWGVIGIEDSEIAFRVWGVFRFGV